MNGPGGYFASNVDALDDAFSGGMGQPEHGRCTFIWEHSDDSRRALGYPETVRQLEKRLERCHPTSREKVSADLRRARAGEGATAFHWLLDCFKDGPATLLLR